MPKIRTRISHELKANKLMGTTLKPTACLYDEKAQSTLTKQGEDTDTRDGDNVGPSIASGLAHLSSEQPSHVPMQWKDLNASLIQVLPPDEQYTYVIETYQESSESQRDAPQFSATIHINLQNEVEAREWINQLSKHSKCTDRITRTACHALPTLRKEINTNTERKVCFSKGEKSQSTSLLAAPKKENGLSLKPCSCSTNPYQNTDKTVEVKTLPSDPLWSVQS